MVEPFGQRIDLREDASIIAQVHRLCGNASATKSYNVIIQRRNIKRHFVIDKREARILQHHIVGGTLIIKHRELRIGSIVFNKRVITLFFGLK